VLFGFRLAGRFHGALATQQLTNLCQLPSAVAVGQEAKIADPHEALGQDMHHETAYEFGRRQSQRALPMATAVVFVGKHDFAAVDRLETLVGDGDAMRVTCQIFQNLFRSLPRRIRILPIITTRLSSAIPTIRFMGSGYLCCGPRMSVALLITESQRKAVSSD
jgi:hypothetical protein